MVLFIGGSKSRLSAPNDEIKTILNVTQDHRIKGLFLYPTQVGGAQSGSKSRCYDYFISLSVVLHFSAAYEVEISHSDVSGRVSDIFTGIWLSLTSELRSVRVFIVQNGPD